MRLRLRAFWLVVAGLVVGAAAVAIGVVLVGDFGETEWRTVITLAAVFLCGSAALAALELIEQRRARLVAAIVIVGTPIALSALLESVWAFVGDGPEQSNYVKQAWTTVAWVLAALTVTTLRLLLRDQRVVATLWIGVMVVATGGATLATVLIWSEPADANFEERVLGVLAILAVGGYFLGPILERAVTARPESLADRPS
jgi:hypothetical protein